MNMIARVLWKGTLASSVLCAGSGMAANTPVSHPAPLQTTAWMRGWPMIGHDAQHSNRSPVTGPIQPQLLATIRGGPGGQVVIGPDGSLYGWTASDLQAVDVRGHRRWKVGTLPIEGGAPALAPDGTLLVNGLLITGTGTSRTAGMAVLAITPTGTQRWAIHSLSWAPHVYGDFGTGSGDSIPMGISVPLSKGVDPLVTAHGVLYMPFVGPGSPNAGVEVISPTGTPLHRLKPEFPPVTFALGRDGTAYIIGGEGPVRTLVAVSPRGTVRWSHALRYENGPATLLIGASGAVYVADAADPFTAVGEIVSYTPQGRLRWRHTVTGAATLAERDDGTILAATTRRLAAITANGRQLWQKALGHASGNVYQSPSLVVDAADHAYVCSTDGMIEAIGRDGAVLWALRDGKTSDIPPACALGPDGTLVVGGTDGLLRMYR